MSYFAWWLFLVVVAKVVASPMTSGGAGGPTLCSRWLRVGPVGITVELFLTSRNVLFVFVDVVCVSGKNELTGRALFRSSCCSSKLPKRVSISWLTTPSCFLASGSTIDRLIEDGLPLLDVFPGDDVRGQL